MPDIPEREKSSTHAARQLADRGREVRVPLIADQPDRVAEESMDSFPASDAPSWMGIRVGPPRSGLQ